MIIQTVVTKKSTLNDQKCKVCFLRTYTRLFEKFNVSAQQKEMFLESFNKITEKLDHISTPEIQQELSEKFTDLIGVSDPFFEEKRECNIKALDIYDRWKNLAYKSKNAFDTTLRLAIAGNIMDYGASDDFDLDSVIIKVLHSKFAINHSNQLREKIAEAKNILYLGDNAGEIVFDRLFIETNLSDKVTYVVKGGPVLNDVTLKDAEDVAMEHGAKIITNGYNAPSTVLSKCSDEFMHAYNSADLIISKGQGNLEGLINENDSRIFFLLMVKCTVIAESLNVRKGDFVVFNGRVLGNE